MEKIEIENYVKAGETREALPLEVVGFAGGSDFVAVVGNFVSDGRHCVPGLVRHKARGLY